MYPDAPVIASPDWCATGRTAVRLNWLGHLVVWVEEMRVRYVRADLEYYDYVWITEQRWRRADQRDIREV